MSDAGVAVAGRTTTREGVLRAVEDLAPSIGARAAEIEAARRMPRDILDDLIDAGCFRLLLPESHGGASADASTSLAVIEALARADASTAWTVMIGSGAWLDLAGLPRADVRRAVHRRRTSSPACSIPRDRSSRGTTATTSPVAGASPAAASTRA